LRSSAIFTVISKSQADIWLEKHGEAGPASFAFGNRTVSNYLPHHNEPGVRRDF